MTFNKWLDTFIEEKGIDPEQVFEVQGEMGSNYMPVQIILDGIKKTSKEEQAQIKNIFVQIDFKNGDVLHFIKHLAKAIAI